MTRSHSRAVAESRRLAAILVTDIVGFSAKAQEDEAKALAILQRHAETVEPVFRQHGGRIVKSLGDGYLVEFGNVLEAVSCALHVQQAVAASVQGDEGRYQVRIGIHLGDVEPVGEDIVGDGVNIASRINHLAEPGGVCLTEDVYHQVVGKKGWEFRALGTPPLKNIRRPVAVYRVVIDAPLMGQGPRGVAGMPSIAVLPFSNFSPDPENAHFCDGLADELINALTRVQNLRVVSRSSSFAFRGHERPLREIGEVLGVGVVVEGSVRKSGNRIRVTAQVIDVASDAHLWSGQYDRELQDIFELQGEIASSIVAALRIAVTPEEREAMALSGTKDVHAYELYLQGGQQFWRFSIPGLRASRSLFREAIAIDPNFVRAYAGLVQTAAYHFFFWGDKTMLQDALWAADKVQTLEPDSAIAAVCSGTARLLEGRIDDAHRLFLEAIEKDPQDYNAWISLARCRFAQGRFAESVEAFENAANVRIDDYQGLCLAQVACRSMGDEAKRLELAQRVLPALHRHRRLHPDDPRSAYFEASVYTVLGDCESAKKSLDHAISLGPNDPSILYNAACVFCLLGMKDRALECLSATAETGFSDHGWMENDMDLGAVRSDPRFEGILEKVRENRRNALSAVPLNSESGGEEPLA